MKPLGRGVPRFDAGAQPHRQMHEVFAASIDPIFSLGVDDVDQGAFDLGLDTFHAGAMLIGRCHMQGGQFTYERDRQKIAETGLDVFMVQIITSGGDTRLHGDEMITTKPGDVCIDDLTRPFGTRAADCANINIVVPRAALGLDEITLDRMHGLLFKQDTLAAQLIHAQAQTMLRHLDHCPADEAATAARAMGLMIGGLAAPVAKSRDAQDCIVVAVLHRIQRYIQSHLADPALSPDSVARAMAMSRAKLYRVSAPLGGVSHYIREQRLLRVLRDLRDPYQQDKLIAEIAYAWGFADWSTFSRAFRAAFGMAPGEAREADKVALAKGRTRERAFGPNSAEEILPLWLRGLATSAALFGMP